MKTQSMFHGMNSIQELQDYIARFNGNDAVVANIVMGITIETMNKIHDREMAQRHADGMNSIQELQDYIARFIDDALDLINENSINVSEDLSESGGIQG